MKTHTIRNRDLPLDDSWDVIVAGGGPAGCTAAIAAAREGARTLLVEATGMLGGMATAGLVPAWCPFTDKERIIYSGLAEEILMASKCSPYNDDPNWLDWVPIIPEELKIIYDDMVTGAGAEILFFTQVCGVETDAEAVSALLLANKDGLTAMSAKVFVDCTGDADIAAWAGAPCEKHDELQPSTHCFALGGVDEPGYRDGPTLHGGNDKSPMYDIVASGDFPDIPDNHCCSNLQGRGMVGFNAGHMWIDATDIRQLSTAIMQGRKIARAYKDALAKYVPEAFVNAYVTKTAPLVGIRETRRIVGDYVLTLDDFKARRSFADEIARNCYFVDIHTSKAEQKIDQRAAFAEHRKRQLRFEKGESHGIPYRCLVPQELSNLLVAGRSISTDHTVQGSTRVMPVCLAMGEAAGLAAAMAATGEQPDTRSVDTHVLRKRLQGYGAYLPDVT